MTEHSVFSSRLSDRAFNRIIPSIEEILNFNLARRHRLWNHDSGEHLILGQPDEVNEALEDAERATLGCVNPGSAGPVPPPAETLGSFTARSRIARTAKAKAYDHNLKNSGLDPAQNRIHTFLLLFRATNHVNRLAAAERRDLFMHPLLGRFRVTEDHGCPAQKFAKRIDL